MNISRYGNFSHAAIDENIEKSVPQKTKQCKESVWAQFTSFCKDRKYELIESTTTDNIASILKDYGFNMRKLNG